MASDGMEVTEWTRQPEYQKSNMSAQSPPIPTMVGEHPLLLSKTSDGSAMVTNFRFCVCECRAFLNMPLMTIGEVTVMETSKRLRIGCKDGATYVCTFATAEDCRQCFELLKEKSRIPRQPTDIFAYRFHFHGMRKGQNLVSLTSAEKEQVELCQPVPEQTAYSFGKEVERLGFDCSKRKIWKMTHANENFEFCPTYPKYHILPATVDNDKLKNSTDFRAGKRFPSVVWRDKNSGMVLIRSSQPLPSFLGLTYYSNEADVFLLDEIVKGCHREQQILLASKNDATTDTDAKTSDGDHQGCVAKADKCQQTSLKDASTKERQMSKVTQSCPLLSARESVSVNSHTEGDGASPHEPVAPTPQLAIVDCRSLAMVWGNSLKGGGTEDESLYKCNIIHLDLANIHTVRDSFSKLRSICHSYQEGSFYKSLSGCMWLNYISSLLKGANTVVRLMKVDKRPVLVHCSDGWDRTAQIVSLSELMMDPYYRTIEGFQVLIEREWLAFGHKFGERGGHDPNCSDQSQQSPILLQFLDCVYQLTLQYPASFQFNEAYLVKLLKHSQACLFGNFLHNCDRERAGCPHQTASVWSLLKADNSQFLNLLYKDSAQVVTARCGEHEVVLWSSVYMAGQSPSPHSSPKDFCVALAHGQEDVEDASANEGVSRSRSMDDLSKVSVDCGRRNSDPNLAQQSPEPGNNTATAATSTTIPTTPHPDTSSSSAEIIHFSESPDSFGFHSETSSHSPSDFQRITLRSGAGKDDKSAADGASGSPLGLAKPSSRSPEKNALRNGVDFCGKRTRLFPTQGGEHQMAMEELNSSGSVNGDHFESCDDNVGSLKNGFTSSTEYDTFPLRSRACVTIETLNGVENGVDCAKVSNGVSHSHSSSHSSSYSSVLEDRPLTSLLSKRLEVKYTEGTGDPEVNGISPAKSFHSVSSSPGLENVSPEERKILTLKQTQQALMQKTPTSASISIAAGPDDSRTVAAVTPTSRREMNGHATETPCIGGSVANGCMNSMSTDTLVGDVEDVLHAAGKANSMTSPLDIRTDLDPPVIVPTTVVTLPTPTSTNKLRTGSGSPNSGATGTAASRRTSRTGTGASVDSSLSPCVCRGTWSDTGRLRHPSGGDSSVRRWVGSSVSTSTTDISDSYIGKVFPPITERQAGIRQLLDVDGLTLFSDHRHQLLTDLVTEKDNKISGLEARLKYAIDTLRAARNSQLSQQEAAILDDLLMSDPEAGEYHSLGALSNPASDTSWEQVDASEEKIVMWMPDDAVTHCAGCDKSFWFAQRKHHCRNCGKIFCSECSNFMAPVAGIYHKEVQRVCGRCHNRLMQLSPGASCDGRIPTMVADG